MPARIHAERLSKVELADLVSDQVQKLHHMIRSKRKRKRKTKLF